MLGWWLYFFLGAQSSKKLITLFYIAHDFFYLHAGQFQIKNPSGILTKVKIYIRILSWKLLLNDCTSKEKICTLHKIGLFLFLMLYKLLISSEIK